MSLFPTLAAVLVLNGPAELETLVLPVADGGRPIRTFTLRRLLFGRIDDIVYDISPSTLGPEGWVATMRDFDSRWVPKTASEWCYHA